MDDAVKILSTVDIKVVEERELWSRVLKTLATSFEHDQDDFWQAPSHFGAIAPVLMEQFLHAGSVDVVQDLVPAVVELAGAADSQAHQKELNSALLKHLRSEADGCAACGGQVRAAIDGPAGRGVAVDAS